MTDWRLNLECNEFVRDQGLQIDLRFYNAVVVVMDSVKLYWEFIQVERSIVNL